LRYLDYYNSRTHFSGHVVALAGYDEEAGVAYLADTQFAGLQEEPLGNLAKARSSRAYPFPVHHDCYPVPRPGALAPFEKAISRALASNARWMIESEHPCGLVALEAAARDVPNWAKDLEGDAWRWAARFTYQVIERRGTGGAAFRRLYYDFLVEGGEYVPALKADRFLHPLDEARNAWHQAAEAFRRASETDEAAYLEEAARRLLRVHARETVFWRTVAKEFS
ncbi:MAG: BtrH N-terminal domain-containing protein, partial [Candidatus Methylomirabilis sp.]|nr:BtrH N-terminal domain-containing protein [Deltaproteobacteria bacterium]